MYRNFYNFTKYPFCNTPDTEFFFNSEKHTEALANLTYVISERKGFSVITGDIGAGKTIVSRELLNRMDPNLEVGLITNTCLKEDDFLKAICEEFNLPAQNLTPGQLLSSLNDFFIQCLSKNKNVILIVDEAQNLSAETLEKIRMLSNLETEREKLIQIILLGQPELRDLLNQPRFEQLRQRINLWYHLRSLNYSESCAYIDHRLGVVGSSAKAVFAPSSLQAVFQYSKGVPRVINTICDNALLIGYIRGVKQVAIEMVEEVVRDLGMVGEEVVVFDPPVKTPENATPVHSPSLKRPQKRAALSFSPAVAAAAVTVIFIGLFFLFTQKSNRHMDVSPLSGTTLASQNNVEQATEGEASIARIKEDYRAKLYKSFRAVWSQAEKKEFVKDQDKENVSLETSPTAVLPSSSAEAPSKNLAKKETNLNFISTESEF